MGIINRDFEIAEQPQWPEDYPPMEAPPRKDNLLTFFIAELSVMDRATRTFTVENTHTSKWNTFRLEKQPESADFAPGKIVLKFLVGASNSKDYKGIAFIDAPSDRWPSYKAWTWNKLKGTEFETHARVIEGLLNAQPQDAESLDYLNILEAIPCSRCGELLTVPNSIRAGIGPVCAKR